MDLNGHDKYISTDLYSFLLITRNCEGNDDSLVFLRRPLLTFAFGRFDAKPRRGLRKMFDSTRLIVGR